MRDIDELLPQVLTFAKSVPEPVALRFIREAAREFCRRTRLWRDTDQFQISTPESEGLCTIPDARVFEVRQAWLDGEPLEPKTVAWLDENIPDWVNDTEEGGARYVTQSQPNTLTVVPKASGLLKLRLVLEPSRDAMTIPDFLVEDYAEPIGKGAAGRILTLPDAEYANPQLGAAYINEFEGLLGQMALRVAKGQQRARLRTTGSYF